MTQERPPQATPAYASLRLRLLALLDAGDLDAALQAGLMDYPAVACEPQDAPLLAAHQSQRQRLQLFVGKRRRIGPMGRAMDAINGRGIDGEIQVGRFLFDHHFEERANIHETPLILLLRDG